MRNTKQHTRSHYALVVTCFVLWRGARGGTQALLLKRSDDEHEGPGLWTIPGGKVEQRDWGKRCEESHCYTGVNRRALLRELAEETGIVNVPVLELLDSDTVFVRTCGTPTIVLHYKALLGGKRKPRIVLGQGLVGYAWVDRNSIHKYICIGNVKAELLQVLEHYRPSSYRLSEDE